MSGSFRTDYHIDFTGSMTGTADLSSGSAKLIIWRTRMHQHDTTRGLLCVEICRGTMSDATLPWMHLMVSSTAWRRYARTLVLWCDVNHHAARRDKV